MSEKKFDLFQDKDEEKRQLSLIGQCYEDGEAEINGRKYTFDKMTHHKRLKVFAYQSSVAQQMKDHNFSFLDSTEWKNIEKLLFEHIQFEGRMLKTVDRHFEEDVGYPEDYLNLISMGMAVFTYPLHKGGRSS